MTSFPHPPRRLRAERRTTLFGNGCTLLTIQITPVYLDDWVAGFLFTKGLIHSQVGLLRVEVKTEEPRIDVELKPDLPAHRDLASKRYLTSGCGKGITFSSVTDALLMQPVRHALTVSREQLAEWIRPMQRLGRLHAEPGGMRAGAVHTPFGETIVREDIGRHNAVDKAIGGALKAGWPSSELVLRRRGASLTKCAPRSPASGQAWELL